MSAELLQIFSIILETIWNTISLEILGQPLILIAIMWTACIAYLKCLHKKLNKV